MRSFCSDNRDQLTASSADYLSAGISLLLYSVSVRVNALSNQDRLLKVSLSTHSIAFARSLAASCGPSTATPCN